MIQALRPVCVSVAVAILTAITVYIASYLIYPVTGVEVEGARMMPETEVWSAIPDRASLLTLNAGLLERRLESNPWVEGAEVSKDQQSGIVTVEVQERSPVLKVDVGNREAVFAADGTELPGLGGAGLKSLSLDENRLEDILRAGKTLEENGMKVGSVEAVGAGGIEAAIDGRRVLLSGEVGVEQARALSEIMEQNPEAEVFDLRSPERVVVRGDLADVEAGG